MPLVPLRRIAVSVRFPLVLLTVTLALVATTVGVAQAQPQRDQVAVDANPTQIELPRPVPHVETLRLKCTPDVIGDQRGILCRWSEATNPNTRGYQLYRIVDGSPRQLLTTTTPDARQAYFDTDLSAPSTVFYGVVARNRSGRVIGIGGPERVELGGDLAELRFECHPDSIEGKRGVLCRWSESDQRIRGYLVYRAVGDRPREVIARIGADGRNAHFDTNVVPGQVHTYAVVAVNADGEAVALGGPVRVRWPAAN